MIFFEAISTCVCGGIVKDPAEASFDKTAASHYEH
jgi:hypothetical protein